MKLHSALLAAFCCLFVISTVSCETRSGQDGNPENLPVITSREGTNDIDKLLQFLLGNLGQPATGDRQVSRRHATPLAPDHETGNKFAISGDQLPFIAYQHPRAAGLNKANLNRLIRRSAPELESTPAPDSETTSKSDEKSTEKESSSSGPTKTTLAFPSHGKSANLLNPFDSQHPLNPSNIFKNGLLGNMELPAPEPVKKIFGFVMDRLKSKLNPEAEKDDQQSNERFPRKLFEHGKNLLSNVKENAKNLAPVGMHRAFKLGPWSVNFDMGKP